MTVHAKLTLPRRTNRKAGLSPGTLVYVGEEPAESASIDTMSYSGTTLREAQNVRPDDLAAPRDKGVQWINVTGVHDMSIIEALGKKFDLHALTLEDIVNTSHRPKVEEYDGYLFVVLKMISYGSREQPVTIEQVSLILAPRLVISFQERTGDVFDPVRHRIRTAKGKIRRMKSDYLAYALIDAVVDNYFSVLEQIGEEIEELEAEILEEPQRSSLVSLNRLKRELLMLRKSIWPLREVISAILREESPVISEPVGIFFRDVYDHTIQVVDTLESYRDVLSGLMDVYLSSLSNRMNEVMKMLTLIATIFIPLTFIAGVYGMNFEFMPELHMKWAYPSLLLAMVVIGTGMFLFFRKKKWL